MRVFRRLPTPVQKVDPFPLTLNNILLMRTCQKGFQRGPSTANVAATLLKSSIPQHLAPEILRISLVQWMRELE